jgi:acyl-CoA synthetase (AMP-forming)/AMP-acid ligase II
VSARYLPAGFQHLTVASGIRSAAQRSPGKVALTCGGSKRTYAQLVQAINRVANLAAGLGLSAGHNAAIVAPNCLEYIEIVAGVSETGAAIATPNSKLTPAELADICNDAQAQVLFVHPDSLPSVDRALLQTVLRVIVIGPAYDALLQASSDNFTAYAVPEWATFSIPYTSGTTGRPKGVMLPHRSRSLGFLAFASEYGIYSPDDRFLAFAPMCHGAGLAFAMAAVFVGGSCEILAEFDPEHVLTRVHSGDITGMFTVPTHHHAFFDLPPALLDRLRHHRLRGIVANAAALPQPLKERIVDYFGQGLLHETYGSTEAGVVTNLRPGDQLRKINCVGTPFVGNQVKLLDQDGQDVATGEVGELFCTSPFLFNGYWGQPTATAEALRDGWVTVGDLAVRDEEGYVYIVDRKKDMVITGGMNVYPREIEAVLDRHPGVRECAVVGVPDARWGEQLVVYVVNADPTQPVRAQALLDAAAASLAPYKCPKVMFTIDALPRNANGKVVKALRARHAAAATGSG